MALIDELGKIIKAFGKDDAVVIFRRGKHFAVKGAEYTCWGEQLEDALYEFVIRVGIEQDRNDLLNQLVKERGDAIPARPVK